MGLSVEGTAWMSSGVSFIAAQLTNVERRQLAACPAVAWWRLEVERHLRLQTSGGARVTT